MLSFQFKWKVDMRSIPRSKSLPRLIATVFFLTGASVIPTAVFALAHQTGPALLPYSTADAWKNWRAAGSTLPA